VENLWNMTGTKLRPALGEETNSKLKVVIIFILFLCLACSFPMRAQDDISIPFDLAVVSILERIPIPAHAGLPQINQCGYEPARRESDWILMPNQLGEAVLCNAETGEVYSLPIAAAWTRVGSGDYAQPALSPDGRWLMLGAYGDNQYTYYALSTNRDDAVELGSIPYSMLATYPPYSYAWLSSTQGAIIYSTYSDSVWDTLYAFNVQDSDSMNAINRGYPMLISEPMVRVESLSSGRWLSQMAGTYMGDAPCEFTIYDAAGLRAYPIGYPCQVETHNADGECSVTRSNAATITVLRVLDADAGQSELVSVDVTAPTSEPTVIFRGEIDYMLQNTGDATLSVLGHDGQIADIFDYQPCWMADLRPLLGSDLLLATERGSHIIPADEIDTSMFVDILATSPDKSRVLLNNGAIYDVVKSRLVANIDGGVLINHVTVTWFEDGRLVFTENYDPATDEQVTIRIID